MCLPNSRPDLGSKGINKMILYHGTTKVKARSILKTGLKANKMGIIYLSPTPKLALRWGDIILRVETGKNKLTSFDGCEEWEVLCWGNIPANNIRVYRVAIILSRQGNDTLERAIDLIKTHSPKLPPTSMCQLNVIEGKLL